MIVRRGDIFYADLSPVIGSEQGGLRPVLIIQNDRLIIALFRKNCNRFLFIFDYLICVVKRYDPKSLKIIKIWLYMRLEALERSRRRSAKASKRGAALKPPASP